MQQQIDGTVERITFYDDANSYTVIKLKLGSGRTVTAVGMLPQLYVGENLSLTGQWVQHKEYGEQFQLESWQSHLPLTVIGIERYLASGLIKGVGPATAKKLVRKFKLETLNIISQTPEQLTTLPGITLQKAERIARGLREHQEIQQVMVFLQGLGIGPGFALKIYRTYRREAVRIVRENPYRLADEVFGIGFKIADQIAQKLGVSPESPYRLRAGFRYLMNEYCNNGHIFGYESELVHLTEKELQVDAAQLGDQIEELIAKKELFRVTLAGRTVLYLGLFYYSEIGVAAKVQELLQMAIKPLNIAVGQFLAKYTAANRIQLATRQQEAVVKAVENGLLVITGGPGTGKTTIIKAILELFKAAGLSFMLAAPTGRAAKRLAEATAAPAKTVHRLLGYGSSKAENGNFQFNEDEPLETDVLIVDEFSMVDLVLFYNLLKALTPGTRLIMVGDVDQLPSVGPGAVLRDLIRSGVVPTVRLNEIFRQAKESWIVLNAHRINRGEFPQLQKTGDFFFLAEANPDRIVALLPDLVKTRISAYLSCDPIEDIQVLAPMRRTLTGVDNLNVCLQNALNPKGADVPELVVGQTVYRIGDKVMQTRNDYQRLVFNGDIGRIRKLDPEDRTLAVGFQDSDGERLVEYQTEDLEQLTLSYAITVHKSQGNEYPVVVIPVTTQHFLMLQRNLLYTAVTRAKKMVVLVGTKRAIAIAVKNNRIDERHSLLSERLKGEVC
ncbi:MAG: ATP-dependent RecD-like DNA helicase [Bacillota bacterium]|jgi:exodeoxyribonuclease V alpha subunit